MAESETLIIEVIEQGPPGPPGATGVGGSGSGPGGNGFTGATGPTGAMGFTGVGIAGWTGSTGIAGFTGVSGASGIQGFTGVTGPMGFTGPSSGSNSVYIADAHFDGMFTQNQTIGIDLTTFPSDMVGLDEGQRIFFSFDMDFPDNVGVWQVNAGSDPLTKVDPQPTTNQIIIATYKSQGQFVATPGIYAYGRTIVNPTYVEDNTTPIIDDVWVELTRSNLVDEILETIENLSGASGPSGLDNIVRVDTVIIVRDTLGSLFELIDPEELLEFGDRIFITYDNEYESNVGVWNLDNGIFVKSEIQPTTDQFVLGTKGFDDGEFINGRTLVSYGAAEGLDAEDSTPFCWAPVAFSQPGIKKIIFDSITNGTGILLEESIDGSLVISATAGVGGENYQIQFNNNGSFGGNSGLVYNNGKLSINEATGDLGSLNIATKNPWGAVIVNEEFDDTVPEGWDLSTWYVDNGSIRKDAGSNDEAKLIGSLEPNRPFEISVDMTVNNVDDTVDVYLGEQFVLSATGSFTAEAIWGYSDFSPPIIRFQPSLGFDGSINRVTITEIDHQNSLRITDWEDDEIFVVNELGQIITDLTLTEELEVRGNTYLKDNLEIDNGDLGIYHQDGGRRILLSQTGQIQINDEEDSLYLGPQRISINGNPGVPGEVLTSGGYDDSIYWGAAGSGSGSAGATGVAGPSGLQGFTGASGVGVQGFTGPQGLTGFTGASGASSTVPGMTGATGVAGAGFTGATGPSTSHVLITQATHGFIVGDVLRYSGSTLVKAQANNVANAEVVSIVSQVVDTNNFWVTSNGLVTGLSGLTAGTVYYLSPTTAGLLTSTEPTTTGQLSKPVLIAAGTTSGYFHNFRGSVVTNASDLIGATGFTGPVGPMGFTGVGFTGVSFTGPRGFTGSAGFTGAVGATGAGTTVALNWARSGFWSQSPALGSIPSGTAWPIINRAYYTPLPIYETRVITALSINVAATGGTGNVVRVGIHNNSSINTPGTVNVDAGTQAIDGSTGHKTFTLSSPVTLTPGLYWLVGVPQGTGSPGSTWMGPLSVQLLPVADSGSNFGGNYRSANIYASVSGALADNPSITYESTDRFPYIAMRWQ